MTGTDQKPASQRAMTLSEFMEEARRRGASFQQVRALLKQRGVVLAYTGHDRPNGRAMKRRLAQMKKGIIPRVCSIEGCGNRVPKEREIGMCDSCLERAWSDLGAPQGIPAPTHYVGGRFVHP
jgi:hypothetical protein